MKKGFTLIELLAVILILGIIALIAVPTVNNVIEDSKIGALEVTISNIDKAAATECEKQITKEQEQTTEYIITNGKIEPKLEIKGTLPKTGVVTVDDNCKVIITTHDGKFCAESDGEDIEIEEKDASACLPE